MTTDQRAAERHERRARSAAVAAARALESSGISLRLTDDLLTFQPSGESLALRQTVEALISKTLGYRWLIISGVQGCGKSTEAARAILRRIELERDDEVMRDDDEPIATALRNNDRFTTLASIVNHVTETFSDPRKSKLSVLREIFHARLLVLDDIGIEKPTEHTVGLLHEIVDRRYCDASLTIFTTNLPNLRAIGEHLSRLADDKLMGHRIIDRMCEMAKFVRIGIPSYRPQRGKETRDWPAMPEPRNDELRRREPMRPEGPDGVVL